MSAVIDTLKIYERLKKVNLEDRAAKEIAEVFKETTEDHLVTPADLERALAITKTDLEKTMAITKADLEKTIANTKTEIIKWVAGMLVAQAAIVATLVKLL